MLDTQEYGSYSFNEAHEIVKKDLNALSTFLGDKHYFFGDIPTSVNYLIRKKN